MTYHEFVALVEEMCSAQKAYFLNHSQQALERAKRLEKRVDATVLQIVNEMPQQAALFSAIGGSDGTVQ